MQFEVLIMDRCVYRGDVRQKIHEYCMAKRCFFNDFKKFSYIVKYSVNPCFSLFLKGENMKGS